MIEGNTASAAARSERRSWNADSVWGAAITTEDAMTTRNPGSVSVVGACVLMMALGLTALMPKSLRHVGKLRSAKGLAAVVTDAFNSARRWRRAPSSKDSTMRNPYDTRGALMSLKRSVGRCLLVLLAALSLGGCPSDNPGDPPSVLDFARFSIGGISC